MYIPRQFELPEAQIHEMLRAADIAQLVTAHPDGPVATLLPVLHAAGEGYGSLVMHLTRNNSQASDAGLGEALAILSGPDAYVAPEWLASFADAPGVPTWNYVTVHAYGELIVHDDAAWTRRAVDALSRRHGYDPGLVPEAVIEAQLRAVVGLELRISRVEAKAKLSQNKSPSDVAGIIEGLRSDDEAELAASMEQLALPHSIARYELMADVRERAGGRKPGSRPDTSTR